MVSLRFFPALALTFSWPHYYYYRISPPSENIAVRFIIIFLIPWLSWKQGEKEEEEDKKSEVSEEEPTLRPLPCLPAINMYYPDKEILDSTCGCLRYSLKWLLFVISFPFMCAFSWTIPNCSVPRLRYNSFIISSSCLFHIVYCCVSLTSIQMIPRKNYG